MQITKCKSFSDGVRLPGALFFVKKYVYLNMFLFVLGHFRFEVQFLSDRTVKDWALEISLSNTETYGWIVLLTSFLRYRLIDQTLVLFSKKFHHLAVKFSITVTLSETFKTVTLRHENGRIETEFWFFLGITSTQRLICHHTTLSSLRVLASFVIGIYDVFPDWSPEVTLFSAFNGADDLTDNLKPD